MDKGMHTGMILNYLQNAYDTVDDKEKDDLSLL